MDITDFGQTKPTIQPYQNGYSIPTALTQVEVFGEIDGETALSWQGYLLQVPVLSERELDAAFATLPEGDYSADKRAALTYAVQLKRHAAYPPIEDYIDGWVKNDDAQIAEYKAKCLEVKERYPLPE